MAGGLLSPDRRPEPSAVSGLNSSGSVSKKKVNQEFEALEECVASL
jgi:hypothetical protein